MAAPRSFTLIGSCAALMIAAGSAFSAPASAPETPRSRLAALIRELDAPTPVQRATASERAQADPEFTLSLLEEALTMARATPLSPEQIMRLEQAARQRFLTEPRAAMGVQFSQLENITEGVEISAPLPGFDSMRALQPGDIIHQVDSIVIHRQDQMRAAIVSYSPGDDVSLSISRQGEKMQVKIKMGSFADLESRNAGFVQPGRRGVNNLARGVLDTATLTKAWRHRRDRLGGGLANAADIINSPLTPAQWERAMLDAEASDRVVVKPDGVIQYPSGEPGMGFKAEHLAAAAGTGRSGFDFAPMNFAAGVVIAEMNAKAIEIAQRLARVRMQLETQQMIAKRRDLAPEQRRIAEMQASRLRNELSELETLGKQVGLMPADINEQGLVVP
ncbi:MAG: PDZ domain-containing protein [Planctomycetota bacterium]|nr:PDZ domain-containing protein [Planctomycetota bacterium]